MLTEHQDTQFALYNEAVQYFIAYPDKLIAAEQFIMDEVLHFINLHLPEIEADYNEASYLYPFWKNYPPLQRGRGPVGDQYPWIEVGEQVFGNKLLRHFAANFLIKDSGLPSGSDDRCIISSNRIKQILGITDSVWVFVDIKSAGPRDDSDNVVMSPYQISGSGKWTDKNEGVKNDPVVASGEKAIHDFLCSLSPIYVLSNETVAPLLTFVVRPVYDMLVKDGETIGQPLKKIKVLSIPNGILLTTSPNYLDQYPRLFIPGKDDKTKDLRKKRARVSFEVLRQVADWRLKEIQLGK